MKAINNTSMKQIPLLKLILSFIIQYSRFYIVIIFLIVQSSLLADNVEWEAVLGAESYQFQVVDAKGKVVQENKDLKTTQISLNEFPVGKYKYKIGVVDKKGKVVYGDWVDFDVNDNTYKSDGKESLVHLEWDAVQDAKIYFVEIETPSKKLIKALKTKTNRKDLKLKIGKYQYRTSIEKNGKKIWSVWKELEVKKPEEPKKSWLSFRENVLLRSAVIPGWGQWYRKDSIYRTFTYPILYSILIPIYYVNFQFNHNIKSESRSNEILMLQSLNSNSDEYTALGLYSYNRGIQFNKDLEQSYQLGNQLEIVMLGVYLFNLVDAGFLYDYTKHSKGTEPIVNFFSTSRLMGNDSKENFYEVKVKFQF
ncbi:MAG: DUF5683 domain-containing protein [Leptospiraceae bacterium]|nr:DUF5683 domain-containing protein [Leptospiraceae bacterium]